MKKLEKKCKKDSIEWDVFLNEHILIEEIGKKKMYQLMKHLSWLDEANLRGREVHESYLTKMGEIVTQFN